MFLLPDNTLWRMAEKHNLVSTINRKHIGKTKRSPAEIIKNHKTGYRNEDVWLFDNDKH